mmetsp:Transcript_145940/g.363891  ORF Transcript_145940/g.363891 Transcript_145940/m.363891 type:complete len:269 (-) Transcript_145940:228-1034(-)
MPKARRICELIWIGTGSVIRARGSRPRLCRDLISASGFEAKYVPAARSTLITASATVTCPKLLRDFGNCCPKAFTYRSGRAAANFGSNACAGTTVAFSAASFSPTCFGSERKPEPYCPTSAMCAARAASKIIETCWKPALLAALRPLSTVSSTQKSNAKPQAKTLLMPSRFSLSAKDSRSKTAQTSGGAFTSSSRLEHLSVTQPVQALSEHPWSFVDWSLWANRDQVSSVSEYRKEPKESVSSWKPLKTTSARRPRPRNSCRHSPTGP